MGKNTTPSWTSVTKTKGQNVPTCWIVTNGRLGTEKQCIALAHGLGLEPEIKRVQLRFPWSILPEKLWIKALKAYNQKGSTLAPPWPQVIISSGRAAAPAIAALKNKLGSESPFTIHIQDPRLSTSSFHKVVAPFHSDVRGDNVIGINGALHELTSNIINPESSLWNKRWKTLLKGSKPPVGVFLGGESRYYEFTPTLSHKMAEELKELQSDGYPLLITPSRRTPKYMVSALKEKLSPKKTFIWDCQGSNPYLSILEVAGAFLVTTDSVSMISELCAIGKPVYILPLTPKPRFRQCRLERFRHLCERKNYVQPFFGAIDLQKLTPTFNDLPKVVSQIKPDMMSYLAVDLDK